MPDETKKRTTRAVIFDFDGTLADSYAAITASVNQLRAQYQLAPLPQDEVRRFVGRGVMHLLRQTVRRDVGKPDLERFRSHHATVMRAGTRLLPGAARVLTHLKAAGLRVAVCSNKPRDFTEQLLRHLGLAHCVDAVLGPEDVTQAKPAPEMLLAALTRLELAPEQALYVGDMVLDIDAARAAGIRVLVVPTGSDDRAALLAAQPDALLNHLDQVLAFVT